MPRRLSIQRQGSINGISEKLAPSLKKFLEFREVFANFWLFSDVLELRWDTFFRYVGMRSDTFSKFRKDIENTPPIRQSTFFKGFARFPRSYRKKDVTSSNFLDNFCSRQTLGTYLGLGYHAGMASGSSFPRIPNAPWSIPEGRRRFLTNTER